LDPAVVSIASSASASYLFPLAAMLRSLLNHLNPRYGLEAYLIDGGVLDVEKHRLEQTFAANPVRIHWRRVDESRLKGLPCWGGMSLLPITAFCWPTCCPPRRTASSGWTPT